MLTLDADGYLYDSFPNDNSESLLGKLVIFVATYKVFAGL